MEARMAVSMASMQKNFAGLEEVESAITSIQVVESPLAESFKVIEVQQVEKVVQKKEAVPKATLKKKAAVEVRGGSALEWPGKYIGVRAL
jgi:hypothetical protein